MDWKKYRDNINKTPGMQELVQNPFVLDMVMAEFPQIYKEFETKPRKVLSIDIYGRAMHRWCDQQQKKLL